MLWITYLHRENWHQVLFVTISKTAYTEGEKIKHINSDRIADNFIK